MSDLKREKGIKEVQLKVKIGMKLKLLGVLLPVVIGVIVAIVVIVYFDNKKLILSKSEELLESSTESVTNSVTAWMKETITALEMERDTMQYFNMDAAQIKDYVTHTTDRYASFPAGIYVATTEGNLIHASFVPDASYNVFEKPWYKDGLVSEKFIFGSVYFDEDSQSYVVGASGMMKDARGNVTGVAAADIYLSAISEIVKQVQLESTGGAFLVDANTDTIIGHKDTGMVGVTLDELEDQLYLDIHDKIHNGQYGMIVLDQPDGTRMYVDIAQVPDSKWVTVSYVPYNEILEDLTRLTRVLVVISGAGCLLLTLLMERLIHFTVKPVKTLNKVIAAMTGGDFTTDVNIRTSDEIGVMAEGIRGFTSTMRETMKEIRHVSVTLNGQAGNSARIAEGLSEASNLQAKSMQEMSRTVNELTQSISNVAENANSLSHLVFETSGAGETANEQIKVAVEASDTGKGDMLRIAESMKDIAGKMGSLESSTIQMDASVAKINSIVELIGEIAEETNLLSLNASIEAARAGESGRGFAVVADQIGKLASTSKNAVNDISRLTSEISDIVGKTVQESRESSQAIQGSTGVVQETEKTFGRIYETVARTREAVTNMVDKVGQVNDIATSLAGITQQQAAASEEILATTESMRENAEDVHENSRSVAEGAKELEQDAGLLERHMNKFTV